MELTKEQLDIINSTGNIKINAVVAGSGRTTTNIEYVRTKAATSKILYLSFNKCLLTFKISRMVKSNNDLPKRR